MVQFNIIMWCCGSDMQFWYCKIVLLKLHVFAFFIYDILMLNFVSTGKTPQFPSWDQLNNAHILHSKHVCGVIKALCGSILLKLLKDDMTWCITLQWYTSRNFNALEDLFLLCTAREKLALYIYFRQQRNFMNISCKISFTVINKLP